MFRIVVIAAALLAASAAASSSEQIYRVELTRLASDMYEMQRPRLVVRTRYCYRYAYSERAILTWHGIGGEVVFVGTGQAEKCDAQSILTPAGVKPGRYAVSVIQSESDWYETNGLFIRTTFCLGLVGNVTIEWNGNGGEMIFRDTGQSCQIEDIWVKARL